MLRRLNIIANRPLTNNLSYEGKKLAVKPDSILNELVIASTPPDADVELDHEAPAIGMGTNELNDFEKLIFKFADVNEEDIVTNNHTQKMNETAEVLSELLGNTIHLAKSVVNPICVEIYTKAQTEALNAASLANEIGAWRAISLPNIYRNENVIELFNRSHVTVKVDSKGISETLFSGIGAAEYSEVCKTGIPSIDNQLKDTLENRNTFYSSDLWQLAERDWEPGELYFNDDRLLTYFFLTGVKNGKHPKYGNEDLTQEHLVCIKSLINSLGVSLLNQTEKAIRIEDNGKMIVFPKGRKSRYLDSDVNYVNSLNFRNWIKEPEHTEEIFTEFLYSTNEGSRVSLENIKVLQDNWNRRVKLTKAKADLTRVSTIQNVIRDGLHNSINTVLEVEDRPEARNKARQFMKQTPYIGKADLSDYIRRAVCTIFTEESADVYDVLTVMEEKMKEDSSLTAQQAALPSCIRILCRWAVSQLIIEENGEDGL